ncbi:glycosyltransferase family 4 protein [bacterium]|nr:glycosyltransferase family 4 protein [bacterium]
MLSGIAFALAERGEEVDAIAGQPAYRPGCGTFPRRLEEKGLRVRRVFSTRFNKNGLLGRLLNILTLSVSMGLAALLHRRPDVILAVTNPPSLLWIARAIGRIRGVPVVLIVHDVYPEIAVALGMIRLGSLVEQISLVLSRWAYRGAARIVALGECMADVLRDQLPGDERGKVVVIPNWADGERIRPIPRENHPLLKEWGLAEKFVVQYSGNIGLFHEIETIVRAARRLRDQAPDVHFLFIGDGGQLGWLRDEVEREDLRNVTLEPFQTRERLPLTLTACDAGLVTLKASATGYCVPSKLYGVLAAGRPVLAIMEERCASARTVIENGCGIVVPPGDDSSLAEAIVRLKGDAETRRRQGEASREAWARHYSIGPVADAYRRVIRSQESGDSRQ